VNSGSPCKKVSNSDEAALEIAQDDPLAVNVPFKKLAFALL
jgi:hypothetical protein